MPGYPAANFSCNLLTGSPDPVCSGLIFAGVQLRHYLARYLQHHDSHLVNSIIARSADRCPKSFWVPVKIGHFGATAYTIWIHAPLSKSWSRKGTL